MDTERRARLDHLMAAMGRDDHAATFAFLDEFGGELAYVVRRHLRSIHRHDVIADPDELGGLVIDAAFAVADRAGSWSPDGALPWTWADLAIRAAVVAHVGHALDDTDPDRLDVVDPTGPVPTLGADTDDFGALADRDPAVDLLRRAITEAAASERDARVHLEYQLQKRNGDPSPARTVAAMVGLSDANVRQIDCRTRRRLRRLVTDDPRYRALADLAWVDTTAPAPLDGEEAA